MYTLANSPSRWSRRLNFTLSNINLFCTLKLTSITSSYFLCDSSVMFVDTKTFSTSSPSSMLIWRVWSSLFSPDALMNCSKCRFHFIHSLGFFKSWPLNLDFPAKLARKWLHELGFSVIDGKRGTTAMSVQMWVEYRAKFSGKHWIFKQGQCFNALHYPRTWKLSEMMFFQNQ